jgi:hypothetical protein
MFWEYFPEGLFYILTSFSWVVIFSLILLITINHLKDRLFKYMVIFCLTSSFNNFLDETIYQNFKLNNAEILVSIFITMFLIVSYAIRRNKEIT